MYLIKLFFALVVAFLFSATITSIFILFQNTIWNIFWLKTQGFDISFFILIDSLLHDLRGGLSPILIQWGMPINMYAVVFIALFFGYFLTAIIKLIIPINSIFLMVLLVFLAFTELSFLQR